jgi:hypothetical protein
MHQSSLANTDFFVDAWCTAEICTAIIVVSLPSLKALIVRSDPATSNSRSKGYVHTSSSRLNSKRGGASRVRVEDTRNDTSRGEAEKRGRWWCGGNKQNYHKGYGLKMDIELANKDSKCCMSDRKLQILVKCRTQCFTFTCLFYSILAADLRYSNLLSFSVFHLHNTHPLYPS